jgi:hypothetical protein
MKLFYVLVFVFISFSTTAQNYAWEVGGGMGTSNYFGDIGGVSINGKKGPSDIILASTRFNVSAFTRRMIQYRFYVNFSLSYIHISGDDKLSPNTSRTRRNLSFTNNIYEGLAMAEYHPLIINDLGRKRRFVADLHLYVSTGIGIAYSDPMAKFGATNVKLRPLKTEGTSNSYSPIQAIIPISSGFFISFKGRYSGYRVHRVGFGISYRFTFTDYLDDVSTVYPELSSFNGDQQAINASYRGYQDDPSSPNDYPEGEIRGNPNSNDGYLTTMIYYSKRINSGKKRHKLPRRQEFYGKSRRSRNK